MPTHHLLRAAAYCSIIPATFTACKQAPKTEDSSHPNVIFFIADDMYPEMFNCLPEGKGKNLTPNIDRLAREGVVLTDQYCVSPVSTASRYNTLTGRYASRATNEKITDFAKQMEGQVVVQWNSYITPADKTIGTYLQEMGYRTGFVGKNHVVDDPHQLDQTKKPDLYANPKDPAVVKHLREQQESLAASIRKVGFDYAAHLYHDNPDWLGIKALASQNMDWITEAGVNFIKSSKDKPFFLYFATTLPHMPTDPPHSWQADPRITSIGILNKAPNVQPARNTLTERLKKAGLDGKGQENLLWLDDALGALIQSLEKEGKLDNTIIFFFNDQGQHEKGTLYQGGIQTQCIVWRSKGFKCGSTCDAQTTNVDFMPTILEMCGRKDAVENIDGKSFAKVLDGEKANRRESMYFELGYARAVVKGNYKYLALRYPKWAMNYTMEQRKKMLEEYSLWRESFGNERVTNDYTLPYGHLEMFPGGGGAEHEAYGKKPGFFDTDQLYDLSKDPKEMVNLAKKPEFAAKLREMKDELHNYTSKLPGKFDL